MKGNAMLRIVSLIYWPLALFGLAAATLLVPLASPLRPAAPLLELSASAKKISHEGLPDLARFQARDGTLLAYRFYPAQGGSGGERLAILAHGSSAWSGEMNDAARALAASGVAAVAIDVRGHGASGTRGDIAYLGQLEDDMEDLVAHLRTRFPKSKLVMIGHSSGGGFALRIGAGRLSDLFDRVVLLAPYLGYDAPTNRPTRDANRWVQPDLPRILAILALSKIGVDWPQSLPVLSFAIVPDAEHSHRTIFLPADGQLRSAARHFRRLPQARRQGRHHRRARRRVDGRARI